MRELSDAVEDAAALFLQTLASWRVKADGRGERNIGALARFVCVFWRLRARRRQRFVLVGQRLQSTRFIRGYFIEPFAYTRSRRAAAVIAAVVRAARRRQILACRRHRCRRPRRRCRRRCGCCRCVD